MVYAWYVGMWSMCCLSHLLAAPCRTLAAPSPQYLGRTVPLHHCLISAITTKLRASRRAAFIAWGRSLLQITSHTPYTHLRLQVRCRTIAILDAVAFWAVSDLHAHFMGWAREQGHAELTGN